MSLKEFRPSRNAARKNTFFLEREAPKEHPFSGFLERELTPERKQHLRNQLEQLSQDGRWPQFSRMANALFVSAPDCLPREGFSDRIYKGLLANHRSSNGDREITLPYFMTMSTFFSEHRAEWESSFSIAPMMKRMKENKHMERFRARGEWREFYRNAYWLVVSSPEKRDEWDLNRESFDGMKTELEDQYQRAVTADQEGYNPEEQLPWYSYIGCAGYPAALHPEWKQELPLSFHAERGAQFTLSVFESQKQWEMFAGYLEAIALIAAEKVEFIEPGRIQLTPSSKKPLSSTPQLPPVKEY